MQYQFLVATFIGGISLFGGINPVASPVSAIQRPFTAPSDRLIESPPSNRSFSGNLVTLLPQAHSSSLRYPLQDTVPISSPFGWRVHPLTGITKPHTGIDFAAVSGSPVMAAQTGWVIYAGVYGGYGNVVVIQHSPEIYSLYAHLDEFYTEPQAWVEQGTIIGAVGSTGAATGPHLHFELRVLHDRAWYALDPAPYLGLSR